MLCTWNAKLGSNVAMNYSYHFHVPDSGIQIAVAPKLSNIFYE